MSDQPPIERPWDEPKPQPKKQSMSTGMKVGLAVVVVAVVAIGLFGSTLTGIGSSRTGSSNSDTSDSGSSMSLSEAFCSDLKAGLTPINILGGSVKDGTYTPQEAADRAYGWAAISCPEELRTNEMLRTYLENWNINPDA